VVAPFATHAPAPASGESAAASNGFARAVREGLLKPRKQLPAEYFYDAVGSALFEAITALPEYGLTRADERLLRKHAGDIAGRLASVTEVAELGSGSGRKTRPVLEALGATRELVPYCAIDVSAAALDTCRRELGGLPGTRVAVIRESYLAGLDELGRRRSGGGHLLVLFLGSSIGNFDSDEAPEFLAQVRKRLRSGDALLLGTDLVKAPAQLLQAYDDPAGVTAAFNLNLLGRINRELGADFQLRRFRHEARWCPGARRIEMHLVSLVPQTVAIAGAGCRIRFEEGESIWTESSHKFVAAELPRLGAQCGFRSAAQWIDREWPFAENLWIARE